MSTISPAPPILQATFLPTWTLADLQNHLGGIPLERIRLTPTPGQATEEDLKQMLVPCHD